MDIVTGKHSCSLELQFSAKVTVHLPISHHRLLLIFTQMESLRSSLQQLKELLRNYSLLMRESTEQALEKVIRFGAAFLEVRTQFFYIKTITKLTQFS